MPLSVARVALYLPLKKQFEYLVEEKQNISIGTRVKVPFGPRTMVGVVTAQNVDSDFSPSQLRAIIEVLDSEPMWSDILFSLLKWCSRYYHYSLGETLFEAMPTLLRKGKRIGKRAVIRDGEKSHDRLLDLNLNASSESMSTLLLRGIERHGKKPSLNKEQLSAIAAINSCSMSKCFLLDGATGSGKTEVYLNVVKPILHRCEQVLVLVPEIGLTAQTVKRFRNRFHVPTAVTHSSLSDSERLRVWNSAKSGEMSIIIGTRSAIFTPFKALGIIIVDEEHDVSYKQQQSLRYHARDVAVMRASLENIPIILGSATPSLETIQNALLGKYSHLVLRKRAGKSIPTRNFVLDIGGLYLESGVSLPLKEKIRQHLDEGNQVLLFLNRRGHSPVLMCHQCGWLSECHRCDVCYTYHQNVNRLRCHHCGSCIPVIDRCHECGSTTQVAKVGVGTEQLENRLVTSFPEFNVIRIDKDNTRGKGSLDSSLEAIREGKYQILIGTQMLTKGHHFPCVTLVAILDIDSALYSSDFRASEHLAQLLIQVSGRAGRASKPGEVILQTRHPRHPTLSLLLSESYYKFALLALQERQLAQLPPFCSLALFRAESYTPESAKTFLKKVKETLELSPLFDDTCRVIGPFPAPIAKKVGRFRWQLLLRSEMRNKIQKLLTTSEKSFSLLPFAKKVRWILDVEPHDLS